MTLERKDVLGYKAPDPFALLVLGGLSRKRAGEVYQGTAHDRPARRRQPAAHARRRLARLNQIAARSSYARSHA